MCVCVCLSLKRLCLYFFFHFDQFSFSIRISFFLLYYIYMMKWFPFWSWCLCVYKMLYSFRRNSHGFFRCKDIYLFFLPSKIQKINKNIDNHECWEKWNNVFIIISEIFLDFWILEKRKNIHIGTNSKLSSDKFHWKKITGCYKHRV